MQTFILIQDAFGGEIRIPVNGKFHVPAPVQEPVVELKPVTDPVPASPGRGRWNTTYSLEFRAKALELGLLMGPTKAAKFLGIPDSTIDNWIRKSLNGIQVSGLKPKRRQAPRAWSVN